MTVALVSPWAAVGPREVWKANLVVLVGPRPRLNGVPNRLHLISGRRLPRTGTSLPGLMSMTSVRHDMAGLAVDVVEDLRVDCIKEGFDVEAWVATLALRHRLLTPDDEFLGCRVVARVHHGVSRATSGPCSRGSIRMNACSVLNKISNSILEPSSEPARWDPRATLASEVRAIGAFRRDRDGAVSGCG